jgi:hypothetical protein
MSPTLPMRTTMPPQVHLRFRPISLTRRPRMKRGAGSSEEA